MFRSRLVVVQLLPIRFLWNFPKLSGSRRLQAYHTVLAKSRAKTVCVWRNIERTIKSSLNIVSIQVTICRRKLCEGSESARF